MNSKLAVSLAIVAVSNIAFAGIKKCGQDVAVKDPGNLLARTQEQILQKIPRATLEAIVGSDSYQGIGYEVKGGASCVIASRDGQDDMSKFIRRDQKSINCILETVTGIPFIIVDKATDFTFGTIESIGDVFSVDATNLAAAGVDKATDGLNKNRAKVDSKRSVFGFFGAAGNGFLALLSGSLGGTAKAVGGLIKGISTRVRIAGYEIPKDVIQQSLRTGENAFALEGKAAGQSLGKVAWRVVSAVPTVILGCEPENTPVDPNEEYWDGYQYQKVK